MSDFTALEKLGDIPDLSRLTDREAAQCLSAPQLDLMFRGSAFEPAVRRAMAAGDRALLASFIGRWRTALPRLVASARAKAALLESPVAVFLLERVVALMLHPAATPEALQQVAQQIEDQLLKLK